MGLIMVAWCLSGFVMMYHGYPKLQEADRRAALQPLQWDRCCTASDLPDAAPITGFRIEILAGRPVLRLHGRDARMFDLTSGQALSPIGPATATSVAADYGRAHQIVGPPRLLGLIKLDQWTLEGASRRGPVYRLRFSDGAITDVYVAERTGEAVQVVNRLDRFLGWIGAVPHWLYPTVLRQNGELWSQVVIWTSLVGVFLTVLGLILGVVRFRRHKSGRWSPYRGWFWWHHYAGLVFGVLTLTWVGSGLLTMNPWGFGESPFVAEQMQRVQGQTTGAALKTFIAAMAKDRPRGVMQIDGAPLHGSLFALARTADGRTQRIDASGRPTPLTRSEVAGALGGGVARLTLQTREDAYLYSGYERRVELPVWRAELNRPDRPVLYLDATSGRLVQALDGAERANRWLRVGLHDWDFPVLRNRPLWDAVVLVLLLGVTGVCATGAWLAIRRVRLDVAGLRRRPRRP